MTSEELNIQLYNKLNTELQEYIASLKSSTPELVIEQAYELVIKEDIVMSLENEDIEPKRCRALLKEKKPLDKLYNAWENTDSVHMDEIRDIVSSYADDLITKLKHSREQSR